MLQWITGYRSRMANSSFQQMRAACRRVARHAGAHMHSGVPPERLNGLLRRVSRIVAGMFLCTLLSVAQAAPQRFVFNLPGSSSQSPALLQSRLQAATGFEVTQLRRLIQPDSWVVTFEAPVEAATPIVSALLQVPGMRKAHPDYRLRRVADLRPNDPAFSTAQASYMDSSTYAAMRMPSVWGLVRGSASVVVAVLDSGALFDHPEMKGRWLAGYDFVSDASAPTGVGAQSAGGGSNDGDGRDADASDPGDAGPIGSCGFLLGSSSSFHGTAVASVIAANTDNGIGMAGVNGAVRILPLRISGQCGEAVISDILDAVYWAVGDTREGLPVNLEPAKVINLSFAGIGGVQPCTTTLFDEAIARVRQKGAVFVAAAGNAGGTIEFPASCAGSVAVGVVTPDGRKASYSAYGAQGGRLAVLMAPADANGEYVVSSNAQFPDGRPNPGGHGLGMAAGTSFSAPVVAGVLALILQARPDFTGDQAVAALRSTARMFPAASLVDQCPPSDGTAPNIGLGDGSCSCTAARCGNGIVAPLEALRQVRAGRALSNVPHAVVLQTASPVVLNADASSAPGGGALSYEWRQLNGAAWSLQGSQSSILTASPPSGATGSVRFALRVSDAVSGSSHESQTLVLLPGGSNLAAGAQPTVSGSGSSGTSGSSGSGTSSGNVGQTSGDPVSTSAASSSGGGGGYALGLHWLLAGLLLLRGAAAVSIGVGRPSGVVRAGTVGVPRAA